jgi:hypothetical protein
MRRAFADVGPKHEAGLRELRERIGRLRDEGLSRLVRPTPTGPAREARPVLLVVAGPECAGKSTIMRRLCAAEVDGLARHASFTDARIS